MTVVLSASKKIRIEQVQQVYSRLPAATAVMYIVSTVLAGVLWPASRHPYITAWWCIMMLITTGCGMLAFFYYRSVQSPEVIEKWALRFFCFTVITGISWGAAGFLFFPGQDVASQLLIVFVVIGVSSASVLALSPLWGSTLAFLCMTLLPFATRFFLEGNISSSLQGFCVLLLLFGLIVTAWKMHNNLVEYLTLRIDYFKQEVKLGESEKRYSSLVKNLPMGIFRCTPDEDGTFVMINPAMVRIFEYNSVVELYELRLPDLFSDQHDYETFSEKLLSSGELIAEEFRLRKKNGETIWGAVTANVIMYDAGGVQYYDGMIEDISDRRNAEKALRESEERMELALQGAELGLWDWDINSGALISNERAVKMLGYDIEDLKPHLDTWLELIHPDDISKANEKIKQHFKNETPFLDVEYRLRTKSGDYRWALARGKVVERDEQGKALRFTGTTLDVDDRKQADLALQKSEQLLVHAQHVAKLGMWDLDIKADEIVWSDEVYRLYQRSPKDGPIKMDDWKKFIYQEDYQSVLKMYEGALKGKNEFSMDHRIVRVDGEIRHVYSEAEVRWDESGSPIGIFGIVFDITERKQAEEALRNSERKYRLITDNVSDTIWQMNLDLQLTYFSPSLKDLLGYKPEEMAGKELADILTPESYKKAMKVLEEELILERGDDVDFSRIRTMELEQYHKVGHTIWAETKASFLRSEDGKPVSVIGTTRDITERKRAEEALKEAKETAEAANKAKSEFLANMSHEIRTPMNAIIGSTTLLLDMDNTYDQQKYLKMIKVSADNLLTIINDILDFSKIDEGKIELEHIDFNIESMVSDIIEMFSENISGEKLELSFQVDPEVPETVRGDPGRLRQVLINLVANAVKFTDKGSVAVLVSIINMTDSEIDVQFVVKDTGIGIPRELYDRIFKAFIQAESSFSRKYGGTGLGLIISKKLVEVMGGKIGFESKKKLGSTFWFTIPLNKQKEDKTKLLAADIQDKRILVVADGSGRLGVIPSFLETWDCRYIFSSTAEETMTQLVEAAKADDPFHIVIIDYFTPEVDGEELGRQIKETPELKETSLILLSSHGLRGDAARVSEIGFDAYLIQPVNQSQLFECLKRVLTDFSDTTDQSAKPIITRHSLAETKEKVYRVLVAENDEFNQEIIISFLRGPFDIDVVSNGREAFKAVKREKFDLIMMDLRMPEMDGFETAMAIRNFEEKSKENRTPILAITAHAIRGYRKKCIEAGMDDYLPKPISREKLFETVNNLLLTPEKKNLDSDDPIPETRSDVIFDKDKLFENVGGKQNLAEFLIKKFFNARLKRLAEIKNAIDTGDCDALTDSAHTFKGIVSYFSSTVTNEVIKLVEMGRKEDLTGAEETYATLEQMVSDLEKAINEFIKEIDQK